ncbi:hypothetical protein AB0J83_07635 [Actinoplanes sp. NPDC049596]|uniref:hypothetical protein n=1 Tax=unclassified Actinoplanes TaxID=2626549 RepID=UPI0034287BD2
MALVHIAVLTAALVVPIFVPYAVATMIRRDEARRRRDTARNSPEGRALHRLDRYMQHNDPVAALAGRGPAPIEQLAFDLRRLHRQQRGGPSLGSQRWTAAVLVAYDERLCMACECLGVRENLRPLAGFDRELERLRVEDELEAAGLELR